ncbi:MAG: prolyl-tRNA synthetase [Parcubacteria group bacterium Gr01-1014_19]|nr:MAG: prolyl-tRNA synthetase [Parcubacteria group bacterium Gr01-1014_19]
MRQSELFTKTSKIPPKDEEAANAKLLTRGGFVQKMSAGVYSYLPLGQRVLQKINQIIREEMNAIGGQEMLMQALVAKEYWEKSKRWHTDVAYEFKSPFGEDIGLGWTHEEVITSIASHFINSYKDLPLAAYQIQTKFRAEPRAKSGILRGREFSMKDLYSFHTSVEDLNDYYQKVIKAYHKIFKRVGLKAKLTEASGGAFTKDYTHEFQVPSPVGEDTIVYCVSCDYCQNKEIALVRGGNLCPKCNSEVKEEKAIEVGNVFRLGTRFSEAFDLKFTNEKGEKLPVVMGSYGIGPTRVMGTIVEVYNDENGILWPEAVSPFKIHLLGINKPADAIYKQLVKAGVDVLYDDRDTSAGAKFADADLLGITWRAVVSPKTGDKIELKRRDSDKAKLVGIKELLKLALETRY